MHDSSRWDLQTKECQLQEKHTCWLRGVLGESLFISEISFSIAFSSLTAICSRFLASTSVFAFANFFSPFFFLSFFLKKSSRSAILLHRLFSRNVYNNREVNPSAKRPGPSQEQLSVINLKPVFSCLQDFLNSWHHQLSLSDYTWRCTVTSERAAPSTNSFQERIVNAARCARAVHNMLLMKWQLCQRIPAKNLKKVLTKISQYC